MPKYKLIIHLYDLQGHICPLCRTSMLTEIEMWVAWREKKLYIGRRLRRKDINLNIDHVVPVADGGRDTIDNLALTHRRCNDVKGKVKVYEHAPRRTGA